MSRSRSVTTSARAGSVVEVARKDNRICQAGTQCRIGPGSKEAMEYLRAGKLGKVTSRAASATSRATASARSSGPQQPPPTRGLRPLARPGAAEAGRCASTVPLRLALVLGLRRRRPRQPGHPPDGHCALGAEQEQLPNSVISVGGRFGYVDDGQTPNTELSSSITATRS